MRNTGITYTSAERSPVILPEMAELLPPLSEEQLSALEADLIQNGCYAPVIVNEDMVIIDGHNRQTLCEKHGLPYTMAVFSFEDLLEAKQWALDNRQSLKNLLSIMYSKEDILFKALKVNPNRVRNYCQKVREPMLREARKLSADETKNLTALESIWYEGNVPAHEHYNWTRYYALNLHSVFYRGTVEWRCFNSPLHAGKVAAYVNLCLAMSAQAITQRSAVMRKTRSDNELYTFRVWLVRLGLNGDEFKNTRDHLLANLEGDRAWRYEKESYERNQKKKASGERER